jgi:hypothetical protein
MFPYSFIHRYHIRGRLSTIRHFFDIDESQARDPCARKRLSKIAGLM